MKVKINERKGRAKPFSSVCRKIVLRTYSRAISNGRKAVIQRFYFGHNEGKFDRERESKNQQRTKETAKHKKCAGKSRHL